MKKRVVQVQRTYGSRQSKREKERERKTGSGEERIAAAVVASAAACVQIDPFHSLVSQKKNSTIKKKK